MPATPRLTPRPTAWPLQRPRMLAVTLLLACAATASAADTQLVTDFSEVSFKDDDTATIFLRLLDVRPMPDPDPEHDDKAGDIVVQLKREGGAFAKGGHQAAADYNQKSGNAVELDNLTFNGDRITGKFKVTINPDKPRPGGGGGGPAPFPAKPDVFEISVDAGRKDEPAAFIADTEYHQPPWRKDTPTFGGDLIEGNYTAFRGYQTVSGEVIGAVSPTDGPDRIGTWGNIRVTRADGGGAHVLARLPRERALDQTGAGARLVFKDGQDWSPYGAVRVTVATDERRDEVTASFGVVTADGRSRGVGNALLMLGREASFDIPLDDLGGAASLTDVKGINFGVRNGHGVGDVAFTLRKVELVGSADTDEQAADEPVTVTIRPDIQPVIEGAGEFPKGLCGVHEVNPPKDGDNPGKGDKPSPLEYLRQMNFGYLRPLDHVGFGGKPVTRDEAEAEASARAEREKQIEAGEAEPSWYYQRAEAADAVDNVVWTHTVDLFARPAWMDQGVDTWVDRVAAFYRQKAADAWTPGEQHNVLRRVEVWNEPFFWGRHTNQTFRNPQGRKPWRDPTQHGYLPGKLGADVYARFFNAASAAAEPINPHLRFGGPSAPAFNGGDYSTLEHYVGHFLDASKDHIDFLTEHHYGDNPAVFAASYDAVTAWTDIKLNKRWPVYNTEANNLGASSAGKAAYNLIDILTCAKQVPHIAKGRAIHALWYGYLRDPGEEHAYALLAPLRGRMVSAEASDDGVLVVATSPEPGRLVAVAVNTSYHTVVLDLDLGADAGIGEPRATALLADAPAAGEELAIRDPEGQAIAAPARGSTTLREVAADDAGRYTLPPRSAIRFDFDAGAEAYAGPARQRVVSQSYSDAVLASVAPDTPTAARVRWHGDADPAKADRAVLRLVAGDVHRGEGEVEIGGKVYPLPVTEASAGGGVIHDLPIDVGSLRRDTPLRFRVTDPDRFNGYTVVAASVLLIDDPE